MASPNGCGRFLDITKMRELVAELDSGFSMKRLMKRWGSKADVDWHIRALPFYREYIRVWEELATQKMSKEAKEVLRSKIQEVRRKINELQ